MDISISVTESKGSATAVEGGKQIGEMTFSRASNDKIIIDHTEVDPSKRGHGIGEMMLDKIVDWARNENVKILPLCPFAKAQFEKNQDIQDVLIK